MSARTQKMMVKGAGGMRLEVMIPEEKAWFQDTLKKYLSEYSFENVSDLQDLDRVMGMELLSYRYTQWFLRGSDYDGMQFDVKGAKDHKKSLDQEIRLTKQHMGMDRKGRTADDNESVADYLVRLQRRAKEFGVHRDNQVSKIYNLFHELKTLMGLNARTDEEEQEYLDVSDQDILSWIRDIAIPEFDALDDHFRQNQRMWIEEVRK